MQKYRCAAIGRDVAMLPSFRRTSPAALPKAGTPRCYERLTATDVDLGYVLEHGELPSWHPQQRSIWRLRRSPLLWWGRWRLRKAQMPQNGSGRFEVGNHGQDLAFPSTSGEYPGLRVLDTADTHPTFATVRAPTRIHGSQRTTNRAKNDGGTASSKSGEEAVASAD